MSRFALLIISSLFFLELSAQPIIRMQNGSLSTCEMFIVDADSMQGNYAAGVLTLTITSANNTRLAFNMEIFERGQDNDNLVVYDGPTTASPVLTTILGTLGTGPWYCVSSGNSLTLRFTAYASITQRRFRSKIRCITDPAPMALFQPVRNGLGLGNIRLADYDKDGDKDVLLGGQVLRNDSYQDSFYLFERKSQVMDGWRNVRFTSADFDNDGDKDIFITGYYTIIGSTGVRASLYSNNGNGQFSAVTSQSFINAYNGDCTVVDFNNDGRPDICYTGQTNTGGTPSLVFKVYLNNGNLSFSDAGISLPGMSGLINANLSWADSDGDGDPDLVMNGHNGTSSISKLFIKNGNSLSAISITLTNTSGGRILWTDVNGDGKPDIVNSGVRTPGNIDAIVPEILFNNGANNFTRVVTNLPALPAGTHDWSDFDNDNDQDVVLCGMKPDLSSDAAVYKNNGNGNFTRIELNGPAGLSTVKWIDINHDHKPDVFVTGKWNDYSYFLKNMGSDSFKKASFPIASYDPSGFVLVDDFTGDGWVDLLFVGSIDDLDCFGDYTSILITGIGWRITAVPVLTRVADLRSSNPNATGLGYSPFWKWGDYDSDGNLDILLTTDIDGDQLYNPYIIIYKNLGNNNFQLSYNSYVTPLPIGSHNRRQVGMFDIDNDGKNEMFVTPNCVFKWQNNAWESLYDDPTFDCGTNCYGWYVDFADYDKDGFMDAAVGTPGGVRILRNNHANRLVQVGGEYGYPARRQLRWWDVDNDGDKDVVMNEMVLENRNGDIVHIQNGIKSFISCAVGDFNQDGLPDLANINYGSSGVPTDFYLNMQGTMFFKDVSAGKLISCPNYGWKESIESFDIDNDGDDDIIHTANADCTGSGILVNMYNIVHRNIYVATPNGGEQYSTGTGQTIRWMGTQIGPNVKIELSRDSMQTWETIAVSAASTATGGSFQWSVTNPQSNKCFVRITDNSNSNYSDISNVDFTIAAALAVNNNPAVVHSFKVYPNPATKTLYIERKDNRNFDGQAVIYNMQGAEVSRRPLRMISGQRLEIDVRHLAPGLYYLSLQTAKKVDMFKIIKM